MGGDVFIQVIAVEGRASGHGGHVHVAARADPGVASGGQSGTGQGHVAPGEHLQAVGGGNAAGLAQAGDAVPAHDARLTHDVAPSGQSHVVAADGGTAVANVLGSGQLHRAARQDAAARIIDVVGEHGKIVATDGGTAVGRGACGDADIVGGHQRAARDDRVFGIGRQVNLGHHDLLAVDLLLHQPDDVVGERGHLGGREGNARRQFEFAGLGHGIVHEAAHLVRVRAVAAEEALARSVHDLLLHKPRFIKGVAQQNHLLAVLVQADAAQKIIRTVKEAHIREHGVGFDEVMMAGAAHRMEQCAVAQDGDGFLQRGRVLVGQGRGIADVGEILQGRACDGQGVPGGERGGVGRQHLTPDKGLGIVVVVEVAVLIVVAVADVFILALVQGVALIAQTGGGEDIQVLARRHMAGGIQKTVNSNADIAVRADD